MCTIKSILFFHFLCVNIGSTPRINPALNLPVSLPGVFMVDVLYSAIYLEQQDEISTYALGKNVSLTVKVVSVI